MRMTDFRHPAVHYAALAFEGQVDRRAYPDALGDAECLLQDALEQRMIGGRCLRLTAYDTQRIKRMYDGSDDADSGGRKALMSALSLYLEFINLFMMMLRLMGGRR
jgi:hypothetical protein